MLKNLYKPALGLMTDLYQITMAYGYWKSGRHTVETTFQLFFRKAPFENGYAICAGIDTALELIEQFRFSEDDLAYLQTQTGNDGQPLFEVDFLNYLQDLEMSVDVDAVPEGTPVLAHEPLLRITGPIIPCQLLESALLTCINFQTLIATKAHRVCKAAGTDTVLEFGLRRAQGFDGAISATRAAYIGGIHATSNVLAGKLLDIPIKGTHAHAWVMMFDSEPEAFEAYAAAMPNNCVFLVDTYDTLQGVHNAILTGQRLRNLGHEMVGIRLDSGDLTTLSRSARKLLDEAGFPLAKIVASDSLNEHRIAELKRSGAQIDIWGVGTNLVTAQDQPALGGVYKLSAQRENNATPWIPKIKLSDSLIKVSNPGRLQIFRCTNSKGDWIADILGETEPLLQGSSHFDLSGTPVFIEGIASITPILTAQMKAGQRLDSSENIHQYRLRSTTAGHCTHSLPFLTAETWQSKSLLIQKYKPSPR
jgi:nicotinate phosphoribosyltransferase